MSSPEERRVSLDAPSVPTASSLRKLFLVALTFLVTTAIAPAQTAPTVSLALTGGGVSIPAGSSRYAVVTASDDGSIDHVELYYDGTLVATKAGSPYSILFTAPVQVGTHTLSARAYDNIGLFTNSAAVTFEIGHAVGALPTIDLAAPLTGAFAAAGVVTLISGTATDSDGAISSVQVFANGLPLGEATLSNGTWTLNWTPPVSGTVALTALVTDDKANAIMSPASTVNITDSSSPEITLGVSPGTTTLPAGATRYLLATVTPAAGRAIARVEFFVNGAKVAEKTTAPYAYKYTAPAATGASTFVARATDNAGVSRDAQLTLNIISALGAGPTVALLAPVNNTSVVPHSDISLAATATSSGGAVAGVQFYQNGAAIGNPVTAPPFVTAFTPTAPGTYAIEAIASDDRGNTAVSSTVVVTAAFGSPTVTLTAPQNGTRVTPSVPLTISATAVGGSGAAITLVEFFFDGALIGSDSTPPYSITFTPHASQLGAHQFTARVTDANAIASTSSVANVTVASIIGSPPTVSITAPADNAATSIASLSSVNFVANAFDSDGTVASVEFFLADTSVGFATREQTTNTYRLVCHFSQVNTTVLTPNPDGSYALPLRALVRDNSGNQSVSGVTNLTVTPSRSSAPSITISATATNVTAGAVLQLSATATDPDGTVVSVQYFANGAVIASSSAAPFFAVNHTPATGGRYNIFGVATDDTGNTTVSASLVIDVAGNAAPTVTLVRPADNVTVSNIDAPIFLEATAIDADAGQALTVTFVGNGTEIAVGQRIGTTNTYRATWTPTLANSYTVFARAIDSMGAQTNSVASRTIAVNPVIGLAPAIAINVPETVTTNSTANLSATATDSDGLVTAVEFFVNRISIGQALRDQAGNGWRITTSFNALPVGVTEVVALATDTSGNLAASETVLLEVTAATSAAPALTITADKSTAAFSQPVQLSAHAFDADGRVTSVQYFANGVSVGASTVGPDYLVSWTSAVSGTFNLHAVATDDTGNTTVSSPITVTARRNSPVLDDDAFIIQTYQDILTRAPNSVEFATISAKISAGTITRSQLTATLAADPAFNGTIHLCAAYYLLMNEWPAYPHYQALSAHRADLGTVIGLILSSNEYIFKYGLTTDATLNTSFANAYTPFAARLWQTAFGRGPSALEQVQFHDNDTASAILGRGYTVAGLDTAIAEFITLTNSHNAAFQKAARAAALHYQLLKTQPTVAQIAALAALPDTTSVADSLLGNSLYGHRYVTITSQPVALTVSPRSGALFRVEAAGQPPLVYQWLFNGVPLAGATAPLLSITNVDSAKTGAYTVVVTSAVASTTSDPALLTLSSQPTRLGNISTRGVTGAGANVLTAGFVVTGSTTKQLLIRVIGPTLGTLGVAGFLADPRLDVLNSDGTSIQTNDNWSAQAGGATVVTAIQQATIRLGAFSLTSNSLDAVVLTTLNPGSYTVQAHGDGAGTGVALIEVYDASTALTGPKAINVSTRGHVGTGENILIAGFVVNGAVSRRVLIRGVGPTLANFGLSTTTLLSNPQLKLLNSAGATLATNDDWAAGDDASAIASAAAAAGAFPLANGSKDSSIILMLAPGAYTAQLSGVGTTNNTGIALLEVYDVDP